MSRSMKLVGLIALAVAVPSIALANSGIVTPGAVGGGPQFETSVTVDTPPLNGKCPCLVTIHGTTTFLNPDGNASHAHATAHYQIGGGVTVAQKLDFTSKTTQQWTAVYTDVHIDMIEQSAIIVQITDWTGATSQEAVATYGTFQYGCEAGNSPGNKPNIPPAVTATPGTCQDYLPSLVSVNPGVVMWHGQPGTSSAGTLYSATKKATLDQAAEVIKHHTNMCYVGATNVYYFEGSGDHNTPNWGKCTTYDNKNLTLENDATGWVLKGGSTVLVRAGLEADARTLVAAAKRRTELCVIGEGAETSANQLRYLR